MPSFSSINFQAYFKLLIAIILSTVNPLTIPPSYIACVSEYVTAISSKFALFQI